MIFYRLFLLFFVKCQLATRTSSKIPTSDIYWLQPHFVLILNKKNKTPRRESIKLSINTVNINSLNGYRMIIFCRSTAYLLNGHSFCMCNCVLTQKSVYFTAFMHERYQIYVCMLINCLPQESNYILTKSVQFMLLIFLSPIVGCCCCWSFILFRLVDLYQ